MAVFIYKSLVYFNKNNKYNILISLLSIFGTILFSYSIIFHANLVSTLFVFLTYYLIHINDDNDTPKKYILAGLFSGISIIINYSTLPILLMIYIYLIDLKNIQVKKLFKKVIFSFIGALLPILILLFYHYLAFGNPFSTSYSNLDPNIINDLQYQQQNGINGISYPKFSNIIQLLFLPYRGLFFYMPLLLFSILGFITGIKQKNRNLKKMVYLLLLFFVTLLYNASYVYWSGDWSFGPRHLIPSIPFLILLIPFAITNKNKIIFYLVSGLSLIINWLGTVIGISPTAEKNPLFTNYFSTLFNGKANIRMLTYAQKLWNINPLLIRLISFFTVSIIVLLIYKYIKIIELNMNKHEKKE